MCASTKGLSSVGTRSVFCAVWLAISRPCLLRSAADDPTISRKHEPKDKEDNKPRGLRHGNRIAPETRLQPPSWLRCPWTWSIWPGHWYHRGYPPPDCWIFSAREACRRRGRMSEMDVRMPGRSSFPGGRLLPPTCGPQSKPIPPWSRSSARKRCCRGSYPVNGDEGSIRGRQEADRSGEKPAERERGAK